MGFLVFSFQIPKTSVGVGGRDRRRGKRSPVTSFLDRQASVGTADGGRRPATTTLRLAANWLAFLLNSSLLGSVYCDFPQIWKLFPFFWRFIEFFVSFFGSSKMVHGSGLFGKGISVFSMPV